MRSKTLKSLLTMALFFSAIMIFMPIVSAADIYVPDDYARIQWAIDNATARNTIYVSDGLYHENVVVNKQLNLIGIGLPTVDAGGNDSAIEVTADVCLIEGFNVTGSGGDHGDAGIYVRSNNNIIKNNIANSNGECGIYLSTSTYSNNVIANTASNNQYGIYLHWSSNYNTIKNNTVNSNSYAGIHLLSVNNNTVTTNTVSNNDPYGISLGGANNCNVTANTASNNGYGIHLWDSSNCNVTANTASNNSRYGIYLYNASNNNLIYNNYFNNTNNAYGDGNNIWNITKTVGTNIIGGSWLGGNYWSDYAGEDSDGDGLGDTMLPYNSSGNITNGGDWLPLTMLALTPTPTPKILFSDDFSDEDSGWVTYDEYDGRVIYKDGCLYVKDYAKYEGTMYGESQRYFTDFILEVETRLVGGTDDNWHVVGCRFKDEDNAYSFCISADGYYMMDKEVNGNLKVLVAPTRSVYIHQGRDVTNLIRVECIGSSLSLSVNGHLLRKVTDATFTGGDIALGANSLAGTFTEVTFDNLVVTEP